MGKESTQRTDAVNVSVVVVQCSSAMGELNIM